MNSAKVYQSITKIVSAYKARLDTMDEAVFNETPPIGGWSYSEVYAHIFDASLLSLIALNKTIKGDGEEKPTHFVVKLILFFGGLPPGKKYKVPKRLAERVKKISKLAAQQFIVDFELQLLKAYPNIDKANPKMKAKHPRMGYLNAKQWLRFIEVHLNHHLKQLGRIEKSFSER